MQASVMRSGLSSRRHDSTVQLPPDRANLALQIQFYQARRRAYSSGHTHMIVKTPHDTASSCCGQLTYSCSQHDVSTSS